MKIINEINGNYSIDTTNLPDTFEEFEKKIKLKVKEIKQEMLRQGFEAFEAKTLSKKKSYAIKDRRKKDYHTVHGEISYERYRVYDRKNKCYRYPLDEWLGIFDQGTVASGLVQELERLAVDCPYRFVEKEIRHWTGNNLTKDTIWSIIQSVGKKRWEEKTNIRRWNRYDPLPLPNEVHGKEKPVEILCIGMDATYVKRQEHKRRLSKKHDVKVAVMYSGKEKINGDMVLTNKQTVIQARDEKLNEFLGRVVAKAISHYGLNQSTTVLLFGDGDPWIRRFKNYIPQAHYRLDPWHVFEKIKLAFGLEKAPNEWKKLTYGKPDELIFQISQCQASLCNDETTHHSKITDLINYLKNNREGLLPWSVPKELIQKHNLLFTWGSGHVESQIQIAVYDRHKQNRMSWSSRGLQNLSTLREDKLNKYQKPKFTCTSPPKRYKMKLGSLGVLSITPKY